MYYYKTCTNWKCCVCFVLAGYKLEHVEHLGCWISKIVDCFLFVMCHIVFIVFTLVPKLKWGNVQMYSSGFFITYSHMSRCHDRFYLYIIPHNIYPKICYNMRLKNIWEHLLYILLRILVNRYTVQCAFLSCDSDFFNRIL